MKKLLTNNLLLKIISIFVAIIIWLLVIYSLNPMDTKTLMVPVTVLNEDKLNARGYAYDIIGSSLVEVQVKARRRDIGQITEKDFLVEANLDYLQGDDESSMERRCQLSQPQILSNADIIEDCSGKSDGWITIALENIVTRNYMVDIETKGTIADDFTFNKNNLTVVPSEVTITGRKSEVDRIYKVVYTVELQDANDEVNVVGKPRIEDSAHNDITDLLHVKMTPEEVQVCVKVYQKKSLKISYEVSGNTASGYLLRKVSCSNESIDVLGLKGILSNMSELVIPAEALSVEGLTASKEFKIDIEQYLPQGVELATGEPSMIVITADVEKKKQMQFRLDLSEVSIIGRDFNRYQYSFDEDFVIIEVEGAAEDINILQVENMIGTLNLGGLGIGSYEVDVSIQLPDGIALKSKSKVRVHIMEIPPPTTEELPTEAPTESTTEDVTTTEDDMHSEEAVIE